MLVCEIKYIYYVGFHYIIDAILQAVEWIWKGAPERGQRRTKQDKGKKEEHGKAWWMEKERECECKILGSTLLDPMATLRSNTYLKRER